MKSQPKYLAIVFVTLFSAANWAVAATPQVNFKVSVIPPLDGSAWQRISAKKVIRLNERISGPAVYVDLKFADGTSRTFPKDFVFKADTTEADMGRFFDALNVAELRCFRGGMLRNCPSVTALRTRVSQQLKGYEELLSADYNSIINGLSIGLNTLDVTALTISIGAQYSELMGLQYSHVLSGTSETVSMSTSYSYYESTTYYNDAGQARAEDSIVINGDGTTISSSWTDSNGNGERDEGETTTTTTKKKGLVERAWDWLTGDDITAESEGPFMLSAAAISEAMSANYELIRTIRTSYEAGQISGANFRLLMTQAFQAPVNAALSDMADSQLQIRFTVAP